MLQNIIENISLFYFIFTSSSKNCAGKMKNERHSNIVNWYFLFCLKNMTAIFAIISFSRQIRGIFCWNFRLVFLGFSHITIEKLNKSLAVLFIALCHRSFQIGSNVRPIKVMMSMGLESF